MQPAQIEVICGCMFSGKTEELIRRLKRATYARQKVQIFKHSFDTRYDELSITTHYGLKLPTVTCMTAADIIGALARDTEVVGIDEVQFYGQDIVQAIQEIAHQNIRVLVSGLDMDFRGEPFGPMPQLLTIAEKVDKLSAICSVCGQPATRTQRLLDGHPAPYDSEVISVGSTEKYEARCRQCHVVPNRPGKPPFNLSPQTELD
jgi:thymidine kinase